MAQCLSYKLMHTVFTLIYFVLKGRKGTDGMGTLKRLMQVYLRVLADKFN